MSAPHWSPELRLEVGQSTDAGRDPNKQVNEDASGYALTRFGHLCVLCDGMGGHYGGREASHLAIRTIFEHIEQQPADASPALALKRAIEHAGRQVYTLGGPPENKVRPGSTVVALLAHDGGLEVAHVGDSRAYIVRSGQIYPLTRDHSMVQGMIDAGFLTEEQAIGHPDANKITRALGMKPEVDVELRRESMELFPGDLLLSASDGLTDLVLKHDVLATAQRALATTNLEGACRALVDLANERGGHDNITVLLAGVVSTAPRRTHSGATHAGTTQVGAQAPPTVWPANGAPPSMRAPAMPTPNHVPSPWPEAGPSALPLPPTTAPTRIQPLDGSAGFAGYAGNAPLPPAGPTAAGAPLGWHPVAPTPAMTPTALPPTSPGWVGAPHGPSAFVSSPPPPMVQHGAATAPAAQGYGGAGGMPHAYPQHPNAMPSGPTFGYVAPGVPNAGGPGAPTATVVGGFGGAAPVGPPHASPWSGPAPTYVGDPPPPAAGAPASGSKVFYLLLAASFACAVLILLLVLYSR